MSSYKLIAGSAAEGFQQSRAKIQLYGGGFGNGKTTALVIKALRLALDYPGSNGLIGRATYKNLMRTVYREFFKWCPKDWIKSQNKNEGTVTLVNDTTIDFRYIAEQASVNAAEQTSNLLSANYDWMCVDQVEDVEITESDFDQMLGRLRGQTPYLGDDNTMPSSGPRWLLLTCNPSLGWVYKRLVKPLHDLRQGRHNPDLICIRDAETGEAVLDAAGNPQPLVEVFEATTYENAQNLPADFITGLEATYRGKMRDRYLLGKWVGFEGLVYDEYEPSRHVVSHAVLMNHINTLRVQGFQLEVIEGYDAGVAKPSCWLIALIDDVGRTYIVDGFYEPNMGVIAQAQLIYEKRSIVKPELVAQTEPEPYADPSIFRRSNQGRIIGESVASMFAEEGIHMQRGNNAILNGIVKVKAHLAPRMTLVDPFTGELGGPMLYWSDTLSFIDDEISVYRWKKNREEGAIDAPIDGKDHALDTIKYMLSRTPTPAKLKPRRGQPRPLPPTVLGWREAANEPRERQHAHRYG